MTKDQLEKDWTRFVDALYAIRRSRSHTEAVQLACGALNVVLPDVHDPYRPKNTADAP